MVELAEAIGPRRAGRPTNPETVRSWCLLGLHGVVMESTLEICVRKTSWRAFLTFRLRVEQVKADRRHRRQAAVRQASPAEQRRRERRHQKAIEELQEADAL
jgi:hypothetical protein